MRCCKTASPFNQTKYRWTVTTLKKKQIIETNIFNARRNLRRREMQIKFQYLVHIFSTARDDRFWTTSTVISTFESSKQGGRVQTQVENTYVEYVPACRELNFREQLPIRPARRIMVDQEQIDLLSWFGRRWSLVMLSSTRWWHCCITIMAKTRAESKRMQPPRSSPLSWRLCYPDRWAHAVWRYLALRLVRARCK